MKELLKKADDLIAKLNRLLSKQDKMEAELLSKDEKLKEHQLQLKEKNERIRQLELEVASLRSTKGVALSNDQSKESKQKINELIREVDKCIAKLAAE